MLGLLRAVASCLLLVGAALPARADAPQLTHDDVEAFMDGIMSQRLARDDLAGAVVVVVKDGGVLFEKGYGFADMEKRIPVLPGTVFSVGSISKPVTATAVMQLVEQGKLDLDADVARYLDFPLRRSFPEPVTLRGLLTHTAGFEESGKDFNDPPNAISELGPFLKEHRPAQIFRPGTRIAYSNTGVSVAGYIVERVSGQPFAKYVAEHVFAPLAMTHSTFEAPLPASIAPHAATSYRLGSGTPCEIEYVARRPAGGMFASGEDMARFMLAHLGGGSFGGAQILQPETVQTMHTVQWRGHPEAPGIAVSFYQSLGNGRFVLAHGGDTTCQHSYLWLVPSENLGVFVALNAMGKDWTRLRASIWEAFIDRYLPPAPTAPAAQAAREDLTPLVGDYVTTRRPQTSLWSAASFLTPTRVTANADGSVSFEGGMREDGMPRKYRAAGHLVFRDEDGHTLAFVSGDDGEIAAVIADGISEFERDEAWPGGRTQALLLLTAAGVLLWSLIMWPVGALIRMRFKRPLAEELKAPARRRRLVVRASIVVATGVLLCAAVYLQALSNLDLSVLSGRMDPYIRAFQLLALLTIAGAAFTLWSTAAAWSTREGSVLHRLGLTAVALSLGVVAFVIVNYHMLSIGLDY